MRKPSEEDIRLETLIRPVLKQGDAKEFARLINAHEGALEMDTLAGTWLHEAATNGQVEIAKWLVENGADIHRCAGTNGEPAIGEAALFGHLEVVRYLLSVGSKLNPDLLHSAIYAYQTDIARYLINAGVDTSIVYGKEEGIQRADMLSYANGHGAIEIVWLLKEKMCEDYWKPPESTEQREMIIQIQAAIEQGDNNHVRRLIADTPIALHWQSKFGSWLHVAAGHGQVDLFHWFVDQGLDINERGGCFDAGPINEAISMSHPEAGKQQLKIVDTLLHQGAVLDVSTRLRNPLFTAIHFGRDEAAELLINAGIDTTCSYPFYDDRDIDAVTFADEWFRPEIAKMIRGR